jgi:hypothetical protein
MNLISRAGPLEYTMPEFYTRKWHGVASRRGRIQAKGGVLEMSEGGYPILMGKWSLFDDFLREAGFFIEDAERKVQKIQLFFVAFVQEKAVEGANSVPSGGIAPAAYLQEFLDKVRQRIHQGFRKVGNIIGI